WVRHATGVLSGGGRATAGRAWAFDTEVWPPRGASAVELDGLYDRFAEGGFAYGPVFQGLRAVWRRGDEVFAEIALPEQVGDADAYGVHPALLDAALHAVPFLEAAEPEAGRLPFAWGGVHLHAGGATILRVRVTRTGADAVSVTAVDLAGAPVLTAESLVSRPAPPGGPGSAGDRRAPRDALFQLEWTPLPEGPVSVAELDATVLDVTVLDVTVLDMALLTGDLAAPDGPLAARPAGAPDAVRDGAPRAVVVDVGSFRTADSARSMDVVAAVRESTARVLGLLQRRLAEDRFGDTPLIVVTRGAVTVPDHDPDHDRVIDLAGAAVWGLVRAAQAEDPGRFVLVDLDPPGEPSKAL
ncbi:polyketide synthase dehydratase domain-containing protein, partial [Streptosporangium amethystogenes]|uniref:polyketide synthase dehydratase domain-containing protein n=1 Tax=Streptosporangium amethystogenes TaxID=2002 RepID=UPI0031E40F56